MADLVLDMKKNANMVKLLSLIPLEVPKLVEVPKESKKCSISPAFKNHLWFPEPRPGKGPAYTKTDMDCSFTVNKKIAINEIYKEEEEKQKKKNKDSKGKGKSSAKKPSTTCISNNKPSTSKGVRSKNPRSHPPISDPDSPDSSSQEFSPG